MSNPSNDRKEMYRTEINDISGKKIRKTVAQSESRGSLLTMPSLSNVTESKETASKRFARNTVQRYRS